MSPVALGPVRRVLQVHSPAGGFQAVGHPMIIAQPVPVFRVPGQTLAMSSAMLSSKFLLFLGEGQDFSTARCIFFFNQQLLHFICSEAVAPLVCPIWGNTPSPLALCFLQMRTTRPVERKCKLGTVCTVVDI